MGIIQILQEQAIQSYRQDCKELTKDWIFDQKKRLAMKMSEITLWDSKFDGSFSDTRQHWTFPEVPERQFSGLKIYAWMTELCEQLGMKV